MARLTLEYLDFDGGKIQSSFDMPAFTADGSDYTANVGLAGDLRDAVNAVTVGGLSLFQVASVRSEAKPQVADATAQASIQWVAQYRDVTTDRQFTKRIGTADLTVGVRVGNNTEIDLSAGAGATLKSAFEAVVISEDGNPTVLERVYFRQ